MQKTKRRTAERISATLADYSNGRLPVSGVDDPRLAAVVGAGPAGERRNAASGPRRRTRLVADLFCGAGGMSTGARRALSALGISMQLVAVNHWPVAIETHQRNHPDVRHYCADLEAAKPEDIVPEGYLDLLMASPTCTYHSRARGGRPTNDQQRMDPWHVVRWCTTLRVNALLIENVPEFLGWGPISRKTGKPLKSRKGKYFLAWIEALRGIGFTRIEWRILNAADYGDGTTRERFFLIARSDGRPIRWPAPTHSEGPRDGQLFEDTTERWRPAHQFIDWTVPGESIFTRKRPLVPKTIRRLLAGALRFGWPQPYVDALWRLLGEYGPPPPVRTDPVDDPDFVAVFRNNAPPLPIASPFGTITTSGAHHALVRPVLVPLVMSQHFDRPIRTVLRPLPTIVGRAMVSLFRPVLAPYYGSGSGTTCTSTHAPFPTITTKGRFGLAMPFLVPQFGEKSGQVPRTHDVREPMPTATSHGAGALATPALMAAPEIAGLSVDEQGRLVMVDGQLYMIDVLFRMIQPRELAAAMSFSDAETEYEFVGTKTEVVRQIGNAVPVRIATALVTSIMSV